MRSGDGRDPEEDAAYRAAMNGTPKCPNLNCGVTQTPRGIDLSIPRAPGIIGESLQTKAIDESAKIVMEDYKMTDLRDDVRPSETAAPKLPPHMQAQADAFFVGRGKRNPQLNAKTAMMGMAALKGAFRQPSGYNPVQELHSMQPQDREVIQPKIRFVAGDTPPPR